MRRSEYLADRDVRAFSAWLSERLCTPGSFEHSWSSPRGGAFSCGSLYEAYLGYRWPENARAESFVEAGARLDAAAGRLRRAVAEHDRRGFEAAAVDALEWGRVAGSLKKLALLWDALPSALPRLDPGTADWDDLAGIPMNSSWTKIYHLLIADFPIYDGRVGAALAYLVRRFLEGAGRREIPGPQRFGWTDSRKRADGGPHRDPGSLTMRFPRLPTSPELHARCNVMAAWMLGELADFDCFGQLPRERRLRALEAALFMIGYELPASP